MTRRNFLKTSGAGAFALAAAKTSLFAAEEEKPLRVALIGCGWYGKCDLLRLIQVAPVEVTALCDVDSRMLDFLLREGVDIEVALQWTSAFHEVMFTYANNIHTVEGGTHLSGLRSALTRTINFYAQKNNLFKNKEMRLEGEDAREGLVSINSVSSSVRICEPSTSASVMMTTV
jgi:hypothetical protein